MPQLTAPLFLVLLDPPADEPGEPTTYEVQVRGSDHLRAELEAKRQGVTIKDAMHTTYLWAWSAMVREQKYAGAFQEFMQRCVLVEQDTDAAGDPATVPVDPTQPDHSGD